jgi:hypothetical protein
VPYAKWRVGQSLSSGRRANFPRLPAPLGDHAQFASKALAQSRLQIDSLMTKFQLKLADRQCAIADLSQRIQGLIVMLTACLYAGKQNDPLVHAAADVLCQDLRRNFTGEKPSHAYFRTVTKLGEAIAAGGFSPLAGVEAPDILMQYRQ